MADIEDDDYGSDTFDDLPSNTLLELERQAFISTQQHGGNQDIPRHSEPQWQRQVLAHNINPESYLSERTLQADSLDPAEYNYDDEDIIDLDQNPFADTTTIYGAYGGQETESVERHESPAKHGRGNKLAVRASPVAAVQVNIEDLQARILQLENDRLDLQKQVEEARSTAQSKAGEAAILRQKAEKSARDYEHKVSTLRHLHAEEFARQKTELERAKTEKEKVATDNRFLEHDLAVEVGRNRQVQQRTIRPNHGDSRPKSGQFGSPATTPKKSKILPYRDGFEDDDLVVASPSKPRDRSKPSTPSKAGAKRKRTGNDVASPIQPPRLPLSEPKHAQHIPQTWNGPAITSEILLQLSQGRQNLRFVQNLLQHKLWEESGNIFEELTKFEFPSAVGKALSAHVFEQLSSRPLTAQGVDLAKHFCNVLLSLWEQCLAESFYRPLPSLMASLQHIFETQRFHFTRTFVTRVVPLAIATSDLVALPVAKASLKRDQLPGTRMALDGKSTALRVAVGNTASTTGSSATADKSHLEETSWIAVASCLQLLCVLAEAAKPSLDVIIEFWRNMKFDFVLLILMRAQPVEQIRLMLQLLQLAVLKESFGSIVEDSERQARREADTIDRLTLLLGEHFESDGVTSLTATLELRQEVIQILLRLVLEERGFILLSTHRFAIGRLFKFLHDSIKLLYALTHSSDYEPMVRAVNDCMKILYHLCSAASSSQSGINVDVRQKLSIIPGGLQLHLLALTRLAFAERIWYERGIEDGTVERAHEMLDEWLSPEEGEGLMMLFGSEGSAEGVETQ